MTRLSPAHQLQLHQGGEEYFAALVQELDNSRLEVRLETYIFSFDASGEVVAAALERAAARGVQVYLAVDGVGTPRLPKTWAQRFERAGVQWRVFSPMGRLGLLVPSRWRRMHRKLCVIDATVAFCGGINILDDYLDPVFGRLSQPRLDFTVRVTGPLVRDALETMTRLWWRLTVASDVREREFPAAWRALQDRLRSVLAPDGGVPEQVSLSPDTVSGQGARADLVLRDNLRNRRRIERAYLKALGEARSEVIIANAYFLPGSRLRKALIHAVQRGVRVRLLLQGRYESFFQYHASRTVYDGLLAAGVEIHEYAVSFLHAKVAVIDSRWATVGSSNLDPLSLLLAREANVVVRDRAFAATLRERLEHAMVHGGHIVDPVEFANRSRRQRVLGSVAYGVVRVALFLIGGRY